VNGEAARRCKLKITAAQSPSFLDINRKKNWKQQQASKKKSHTKNEEKQRIP